MIFRKMNTIIFFNYSQTPLDMYNVVMYYSKFIVSDQKEDSISIQRIRNINTISMGLPIGTLKESAIHRNR